MTDSMMLGGEVRPLRRQEWSYYVVVNDDGSGSSMFSILTSEFDALERAESWVKPGYHLEKHTYEAWSTPTYRVSAEPVLSGRSDPPGEVDDGRA